MKQKLRKLVYAIILFLSSILIGITGYTILEDFSLVDALYMSIITLSTVGFSEVHRLSDEGKVFTSVFILVNLAILGYVLSILTSYIFEGGLKVILKTYMEERRLEKLKDHIILCGYGRNGSRASEELVISKKDFVIIEKSSQVTERLVGFHVINGDATSDDVLRQAGIDRARVIIITTPSDAANVFISLTARALNPSIKIISRASEPETEGKLYRAGADKVIMPDLMGGMLMAQLVTKPVVMEFLDLLTGVSESAEGYHLEEIGYKSLKPSFQDKALKDLKVTETCGSTIVGMKDDKKGLIPGPSPETVIGPDDYLIVLGSHTTLKSFMDHYTTITYTAHLAGQH